MNKNTYQFYEKRIKSQENTIKRLREKSLADDEKISFLRDEINNRDFALEKIESMFYSIACGVSEGRAKDEQGCKVQN